MEFADLLGGFQLLQGETRFVHGPLAIAAREGHLLILNEIDLMDPAELAAWARRDPVEGYAARLIQEGVCTSGEVEAMRREGETTVEEAVAFADDSPEPPPEGPPKKGLLPCVLVPGRGSPPLSDRQAGVALALAQLAWS